MRAVLADARTRDARPAPAAGGPRRHALTPTGGDRLADALCPRRQKPAGGASPRRGLSGTWEGGRPGAPVRSAQGKRLGMSARCQAAGPAPSHPVLGPAFTKDGKHRPVTQILFGSCPSRWSSGCRRMPRPGEPEITTRVTPEKPGRPLSRPEQQRATRPVRVHAGTALPAAGSRPGAVPMATLSPGGHVGRGCAG